MIPKIIHYCWFGHNQITGKYKKCINSWKKYCKDYQIIEWNEDNYNLSSAPLYVQQAYKAKKWAFVSDYVRLDVVYRFGGIYLDTDVELIKPIDSLLQRKCYFGYEGCGGLNTGLGFGAEKETTFLLELMDYYQHHSFLLEDGSFDETPCPSINWEVFERYGAKKDNTFRTLKNNITLFPKEYFDPAAHGKTTKNTFSIHHYEGSWKSPEMQVKNRINAKKLYPFFRFLSNVYYAIRRAGKKLLGDHLTAKLKAFKEQKKKI